MSGSMCSQCYHDGCCDGLPYCGGLSFAPSHEECEWCGEMIPADELEETDDGELLCPDCYEKYEAKEEEEEEEE